MSINDITICTKPKTFIVRPDVGFGWSCIESGHDWKILVFCDEYDPPPAIAICTKCAKLEGGWVHDE